MPLLYNENLTTQQQNFKSTRFYKGPEFRWKLTAFPRMESVHRRRVRDFQKTETTVQVEAWHELSQGAQAASWKIMEVAVRLWIFASRNGDLQNKLGQ